MSDVFIEQIAVSQGWYAADVQAEEVQGGFTKAGKFVISHAGETAVFAKVVDPVEEPLDAEILRTEADHYQTFGHLGILGKFLPEFVSFIDTSQLTALLIENLPDATWGGPWTQANVKNLYRAITGVHQTVVPDDEKAHITAAAQALDEVLFQHNPQAQSDDEEARLFEQTWSDSKTIVTNSRGQAFFQADPQLYPAVKAQLTLWDKHARERLILRDLNFGNIAVLPERVMFVDPVYANIGNPATDMVNLGLGILRVLPENGKHNATRQFVKANFLDDLPALANMTRSLLAKSTLAYKGQSDSWMDYHQELAVTALDLWQELLSPK